MEKNDPTLAGNAAEVPVNADAAEAVAQPEVDNAAVDALAVEGAQAEIAAETIAEEGAMDEAVEDTKPGDLVGDESVVAQETAEAEADEAVATDSEPLIEDVNAEPDENDQTAVRCDSLDDLIELAKQILEKPAADISRDDISRLRSRFNQLTHVNKETSDDAGLPAEDAPTGEETVVDDVAVEPQAEEFKTLLNLIKDKKTQYTVEQEALKAANLDRKNDIIAQINTLAEDTDNVNRTFQRYRELQDEFNAVGAVPATDETDVWKRFQEARERYSDNLKINKELRDYDFKKNLEQKELLISEAGRLNDEPDIITAFKRLQELHGKWREIGPVAKELREQVWQRFKDASAEVSKRYQAFFEERKAREVENERAKTELCERLEAIDVEAIDSFNGWDENTRIVLEAQEQWRKLGFASRKLNTLLFTRFRASCDKFFAAKAAYYKAVKERMAENLALKTALADEAESLKDSTDWKKTTDRLVELQKQWKTIGAVAKKHSDNVWRRFQQACDYFFEQKKAVTSGVRQTEQANLQAKRDLIAELDKITAETPKGEALTIIANLQSRWKEVGHVPFKEKDKVYEQFRTRINEVRRAFDLNERRDRMERFETSMAQLEGDRGKLARERERLAHTLETRRVELRTYENNLGFLNAKSKSGNSLVRDFERKIERLKADIVSLEEKIKLVDSKL